MAFDQYPAKFGKYILLDRLNAGGMAEVFVAKASGVEGFERLVAIKCMLPALVSDSQFTAMFVDEARLAAQVAHANVVQIYELGRQAERLYIAMELVHGRDLRHIIRTAQMANVQLPAAFSAYVISKAAEGLDYAHRRFAKDGKPLGLVHRDVSPQNILVSYDGEVKVVDFGIAKAAAEVRATETQVGVLKGKFAYMAPEQVMGEAIDRRADIFALGSVLFESLSGQRLFTGENDLVVLERVRDAVLPNLRALLPAEAERTLPVLTRALSLLADMRYSYASEMAEALEPMLIEDQSIFGAKRAASVMHGLYQADIEHNAALLRSYADVTLDNCVYEIGADKDNIAAPVVYESTFFGPTPTPGPAPGRSAKASTAMPATEILTGGHDLDDTPLSGTAAATRRPVTLTRRGAQKSAPAVLEPTRPHLDALAAPVSIYEPLPIVTATVTTTRAEAKAEAGAPGKKSSVRHVALRLRVLFAVVVVGFCALIFVANLSMDEPMSAAQVSDSVMGAAPWHKAQALGAAVLEWRPVDAWLFGHETRSEPTALARHLAQRQSRKADGSAAAADDAHDPADAAAASPAAPVDLEGFVTITIAKNMQALVRIDDQEATWAPVIAKGVPMGHHVVHAVRHRANGKEDVREIEIDVGPAHVAQSPLTVTLTF